MDWLQTGAVMTLLPRQWAGRNKTLLHRLTPAGQPDYRALAERCGSALDDLPPGFGDGSSAGDGNSYAHFGEDGRLVRIVGFFDA